MRHMFTRHRHSGLSGTSVRQGDKAHDLRNSGMNIMRNVLWGLIACTTIVYLISLGVPLKKESHEGATAANENGLEAERKGEYVVGSSVADNTRSTNEASQRLNGTQVILEDGTELVFQQVESGKAAGTVLFFHGCQHSSTDYWPFGGNCLGCIGLPEEERMIRLTLGRNLSAVAISSTNRHQKCWTTRLNGEGDDYDRVRSTMKYLEEKKIHSDGMDLYGVGASSGGAFVTSLRSIMKMQAVNTIVAGSVAGLVKDEKWGIPGHAFTHMGGRDGRTRNVVAESKRWLEDRGISVMVREVHPRPLSAEWLSESVPRWDLNLCKEVIAALRLNKVVNEDTGELVCDPRKCDWRSAVMHLKGKLNDSLIADRSALSEELNRAWAGHESSADFFGDVLDFFVEHGGSGVGVEA